jgi:hypothetical protein
MLVRNGLFTLLVLLPTLALAEAGHTSQDSWLLLALAIIIGGAGISWIVRKLTLPTVLGELLSLIHI